MHLITSDRINMGHNDAYEVMDDDRAVHFNFINLSRDLDAALGSHNR